jgi:hypothetical protein
MLPRFWKEVICVSLLMAGIVVGCSPANFSSSGGGGNPPVTVTCNPSANCVTTTLAPKGANYDYSVTVPAGPNQADILFVVDNSGSMSSFQNDLAARLGSFIQGFSSKLDWRIAVITTDMDSDTTYRNGHLVELSGAPGQYWITKATSSAANVFKDTVTSVGQKGSGDSRAIFAAMTAINRNEFSWIRSTGNLTVIVLSDEDERGQGGNEQNFAMIAGEDYPQDLTGVVTNAFPSKVFLADAIVIDPSSSTGANCLNSLNASKGGSNQSYTAQWYSQLTQVTGGRTGNICASDYSGTLNNFGHAVAYTPDPIVLNCTPVNNAVNVTITPAANSSPIINGTSLTFSPQLAAGTVVRLKYSCP